MIEPIAVSGDVVLHALVTLKSRTIRGGTVKLPKAPVVNELDVPMRTEIRAHFGSLKLNQDVSPARMTVLPPK